MIAHFFAKKVKRAFSGFMAFFSSASTDYVQVDPAAMVFSEFTQLAVLANNMAQTRESSRRALSKSEQLLKKVAAHYPCFLLVIDTDLTIRFASGNEFQKHHLDPDQFQGKQIEFFLGTHVDPILEKYQKAQDGEEVVFEITIDHQIQRHSVLPLASDGDDLPGLLVIIEDITRQKQTEAHMRSSLKEKETLLQEIHHRVKNNMQVISSLMNLQANASEDIQIRSALKESQGRVYAMAAVHETLYSGSDIGMFSLNAYLSKITNALIQTYSVSTGNIAFNIASVDIQLRLEKASPLGLVFNELISNALKYAFPDNRRGEITVDLKMLSENQLEISVADNGVGFPDAIDWRKNKSLGLHLVKTLVENQLEGTIDMENSHGTRFTIRFNPNG